MPNKYRFLAHAAAVVALVAGIIVAMPALASAHDSIESSSPAEGERLESAPLEVRIVFSAEVLPIGAAIVVIDGSDKDWVVGDPVIEGSTVSVQLAAGMPDAGYQVRWRVVSGDGHPISSLIPFTVGSGEPLDAAPESSEPTTAPTDAEASDAAPVATGTLLLIGLGGALVAVAIFAVAAFFSRRRRSSGPPASPAPAHTPKGSSS